MFTAPVNIFFSVLAVSLASLTGVFLLSLHQSFLRKILLSLVSFAAGALFANVFLHILPEIGASFRLVLLGILLSFVVEKFIYWHHCHNLDCRHRSPVGTLMLMGDGIHNMTDGMAIAAAYLISPELGLATTVAVILHEIPQEIGDFAVLLHSGYSRARALAWNFLSALTAFLGAAAILLLHGRVQGIETMLLPLAAGNFLYIAGSDLIPELHKEPKAKSSLVQLLAMLAGIALMWSL
ncbi:hypothetical protein A3H22_00075 [Candidatus Peribacteria bacterium RIFCSPLOWO2_12_FULL_55_15]|nr:MAG: hypothetical protein A2789_01380 [Candidatus Peribacteria bacterium RIFCSPHIGHO2_01_FULL_54_22]OGJ63093.1 MAG: hypothetical protein A3D12_02625 [Candidatus Peribacteria bacterium RIFCSPHIGHO2_02_FULL_55_24]OGJ64374.1 MAG: hypothetical protein A3E47_01570 [Candidatus Peribacteria bacterium RIFCSPHIGHO2_12_FULL_54_10]OGJ70155.1 MAG: hypothetical protein A3H90_00415 [Candidatus Peribacteria bacterium RIFCSPLOWO2_02_FULL_55_36]OGJ71657.1 MAG: hypothetical protein A3H22_00075 [Candidatus Per